MADAVMNGEMCESCSETLGEATGYPRRCTDCEEQIKRKRRLQKQHQDRIDDMGLATSDAGEGL